MYLSTFLFAIVAGLRAAAAADNSHVGWAVFLFGMIIHVGLNGIVEAIEKSRK